MEMIMEMSSASPPSTPRAQSKVNRVTPSTCDRSPIPGSERKMSVFENKVPDFVDTVSVSPLLPKLPKMDWEFLDGHDKVPTTYWNLEPTSTLMQAQASHVEPRTPKRSSAQLRDVFQSPPPAPQPEKFGLNTALMENDFLKLFSILSKNPKLANMPLLDGSNELPEFPLERAIRLQCDPMIVQILEDNGAQRSEDIAYRPMFNFPFIGPCSIFHLSSIDNDCNCAASWYEEHLL